MEDTQNIRRRRRNHSARLAQILILAVLCVFSVTALWAFEGVPSLAEKRFGPASPDLSTVDRFTYSVRLLLNTEALTVPENPEGTASVFEIGLGESVGTIATRLRQQGLIRDAAAFRLYLVYAGLDREIQAGKYEINPRQNAMEIGKVLQDSTPKQVDFPILPGWRVEEIAASLKTSGLSIRKEDFVDAVLHPGERVPKDWPEIQSLEGFLFPDVYHVDRGIGTDALIKTFVSQFNEKVNDDLRTGFDRQGLNLAQAVTLASIIQRESVVAEEDPLIASVFYNRLNSGMKLDSDASVQYAVGFNTGQNSWWTNPLSNADLGFNSPYNTYVYSGLPPGPICNPGIEALQAVAHPAQTPYFYFRARCDGSGKHNFVATYEEQLQNACP
jgi:UPF0755 protein